MVRASAGSKIGNLFLDHLPQHIREALDPLLTALPAHHGDVVFECDEPIEHVVFPIHSVISVVLEMAGGEIAEVGLIGREGMSGVPIVLGKDRAQQRGVIQIPDGAYSMAAADFRKALEDMPELRAQALSYTYAQFTTNAHLSACNTLHSTNERCARWFLMAHDRVEGDHYFLTHEFLSQMLGVRRSSVTLAASALQQLGYITYTRGRVTVLDRAGLESVSCECYAALERDLKKAMGYSSSKNAGI